MFKVQCLITQFLTLTLSDRALLMINYLFVLTAHHATVSSQLTCYEMCHLIISSTSFLSYYNVNYRDVLHTLFCFNLYWLALLLSLIWSSVNEPLSVSSLLSPSKLLLRPGRAFEPWQHTHRRGSDGEFHRNRWAGCWPAKLISHSPGTHNASRVTVGITEGQREKQREGGRNIGGEILKDSISLTWVQVLAIETSCSFWAFNTFTSLYYVV